MGKLDGKVALITGAGSGIGKETAKLFAAEGAKVVCAARTMSDTSETKTGTIIHYNYEIKTKQNYHRSLGETVSEIQKAGGSAIGIQTDITDPDNLDYLIFHTKRIFGPVDILINNAALSYFINVREFPVNWWKECFETNIHAPFMLCQKVLPTMIEKHSGVIINLTSGAAIGPGRGPYKDSPAAGINTMYGTTKAAIERFTQGLAEEVYKYGISVSCIAPSNPIATSGAIYHGVPDRIPQSESIDLLVKAILILATEPLDKITGRVTYSQVLLKEHGMLDTVSGFGTNGKSSKYSC
ncbi:MAG: SDR family NAD(P)-dependent oxidoreductase [Dehalococcoidales bacterium]|nr:SDR family NAD(P)-dependent oxidoreductase [Dehalococcoidales bacterium]